MAAARIGSITKAAAELGLSQPALSRQIQGLERSLGVRLFDRVGRRLRLTTAGDSLVQQVGPILEELTRTTAGLGRLRETRSGRLRLGAIERLAAYVLPAVLRAFRAAHPRLDLRVTCATDEVLPVLVAAGELDLAVTAGEAAAAPLVRHPLWQEELVLVLPPRHPSRSRSIANYAAERFLLPPPTDAGRRRLDRRLAEQGLHLTVAVEHTNVEVIKALVGAGLGLSLLPASVVRRETRSGELAAWPLVDLELVEGIVAITDARRESWPAEQALLEALRSFGRR